MLRKIAFVYRRRYIPWPLTKERIAFQVDEADVYPVFAKDWDEAVKAITSFRERVAKFNARTQQQNAFRSPVKAYHLQ